jgi:hypothetical protein
VDHEIVFPPSGSNSTQQQDSVIFMWGYIYPPRFQHLLVRNLITEVEKTKIAPPPVCSEGQVRLQQLLRDWRSAIANTGQQSPALSAAVFVQPTASARPPHTRAQNVMWVCAWRLASRTIKRKLIWVNSACVHVCVWWQNSDPRCHVSCAATRIMWVIKYLPYILYNACNLQD